LGDGAQPPLLAKFRAGGLRNRRLVRREEGMEIDPPADRLMSRRPDAGHDEWVRVAVARFEGPLCLYATRLLRDPESARDVVQETFLKLCASDRSAIETHLAEWLFTVCRNRALDVLRKEQRMSQLREEQVRRCLSADPTPLDAVERQELGRHVLELMELLPVNQREVLRLKFQSGFSYQEISRITGHSISNVGYLIHAGIKALRGQLFEGQAARARA
jgi:RNA polymerase sigma factor (sigma-70 family)